MRALGYFLAGAALLVSDAKDLRATRTPGAIIQYDFTQAECQAGEFLNTGEVADGMKLYRNKTLTKCVNGAVGVESTDERKHYGPRRE